jgi:hypothetical protein
MNYFLGDKFQYIGDCNTFREYYILSVVNCTQDSIYYALINIDSGRRYTDPLIITSKSNFKKEYLTEEEFKILIDNNDSDIEKNFKKINMFSVLDFNFNESI